MNTMQEESRSRANVVMTTLPPGDGEMTESRGRKNHGTSYRKPFRSQRRRSRSRMHGRGYVKDQAALDASAKEVTLGRISATKSNADVIEDDEVARTGTRGLSENGKIRDENRVDRNTGYREISQRLREFAQTATFSIPAAKKDEEENKWDQRLDHFLDSMMSFVEAQVQFKKELQEEVQMVIETLRILAAKEPDEKLQPPARWELSAERSLPGYRDDGPGKKKTPPSRRPSREPESEARSISSSWERECGRHRACKSKRGRMASNEESPQGERQQLNPGEGSTEKSSDKSERQRKGSTGKQTPWQPPSLLRNRGAHTAPVGAKNKPEMRSANPIEAQSGQQNISCKNSRSHSVVARKRKRDDHGTQEEQWARGGETPFTAGGRPEGTEKCTRHMSRPRRDLAQKGSATGSRTPRRVTANTPYEHILKTTEQDSVLRPQEASVRRRKKRGVQAHGEQARSSGQEKDTAATNLGSTPHPSPHPSSEHIPLLGCQDLRRQASARRVRKCASPLDQSSRRPVTARARTQKRTSSPAPQGHCVHLVSPGSEFPPRMAHEHGKSKTPGEGRTRRKPRYTPHPGKKALLKPHSDTPERAQR